MGKEWHFWCTAGGGSAGGGGRREAGSPSGCLTGVFHIFDFHRKVPTNFSSTPSIFPPEDQKPPILKGLEAPRNSLEMNGPFLHAPNSLSSAMKMDDHLHIPMGIQIKTRRVEAMRSSTSEYTSSPDYFSSPGAAKTPTLVARLMGLDLLPDTSSPSPTSSNRSSKIPKPTSKSHLKNTRGIQSLPETPRISSARKSDVDRRLSLQNSRDSIDHNEMSSSSKIRFVRRGIKGEDEVRDRVREIKEGVSRRFGLDITNKVNNRGFENKGIESEIVLLKANKTLKMVDELGSGKYSTKLLEKEKQNRSILMMESGEKHILKRNGVLKNKQTEAFGISNMRKITKGDLLSGKKKFNRKSRLSNDILKINGVSSSVLPVKKEPSFPPTKLPPRQKKSQASNSQLSSSSSHKYKQPPADKSIVNCTNPDRSNGTGSTTWAGPDFLQYTKEILVLSDINTNSPTYFTKLHLDPTIFNYLELSHSHFTLRCNRKLIYELVRELSEEIFRPVRNFETWGLAKSNEFKICDSELIEKVCDKIRRFPEANCQVLEDIDALIDGDFGEIELLRLTTIEEEGVAIVEEIGVVVLDMMVNELAMEML